MGLALFENDPTGQELRGALLSPGEALEEAQLPGQRVAMILTFAAAPPGAME